MSCIMAFCLLDVTATFAWQAAQVVSECHVCLLKTRRTSVCRDGQVYKKNLKTMQQHVHFYATKARVKSNMPRLHNNNPMRLHILLTVTMHVVYGQLRLSASGKLRHTLQKAESSPTILKTLFTLCSAGVAGDTLD